MGVNDGPNANSPNRRTTTAGITGDLPTNETNPLVAKSADERSPRFIEGVDIIVIAGIVFDLLVAGYFMGGYLPNKLKDMIITVIVTVIMFGLYWTYLGWTDTHGTPTLSGIYKHFIKDQDY